MNDVVVEVIVTYCLIVTVTMSVVDYKLHKSIMIDAV